MFTIQEITRTEATKLVELYMKCTNDPLSQKGRKCKYTAPMKTFRNMTSDKNMGAVLVGKGDSKEHTKNSDMFFNIIKELVESVAKEKFVITQKRIRTTLMSDLEKFQSLQITMFLKSAIDNYLQQTHEYIKETLSDNTYEYNDCSVCKWTGTDYFYYSTIYGLNVPVCSMCVEEKEKEEFDNYSECSDSCCDGNNEEEEEEEDDDDDDEEDDDLCDDPYCQENDDVDDPEKFFGCEGCQYEWRDGYKKGWKTAMKQIKKFANQQKRPENIHIPECAYCGASHNLKKCAGTCEGAVRYCSKTCQKKDWKEGHRIECSK